MKVQSDPPIHLTYCLNVHPGESWAENFAAIRRHAAAVRRKVLAARGAQPFGLGLRLSAAAACELARPDALAGLKDYLRESGMYVFTINGFPYGAFHGTAVKADVYRPDWRERARLDYTISLANILAELLDESVAGSISTVPCSYKPWIAGSQDVARMAALIAKAAEHLEAIQRDKGRHIVLALEPEPDCWIENTDETIRFFEQALIPAAPAGLGEDALRRHVGVCLDASHLAVEFEDLAESLDRLAAAGIRVAKIHLSSALKAAGDGISQLGQFVDPVYLHQVKVRSAAGQVSSYADLPDALKDHQQRDGDEWRVHFHVPLFFEGLRGLSPTTDLFTPRFADKVRSGAAGHLEIETYTFGVLPAPLRPADVADAIAAEYEWVLGRLFPRPRGE